MSVDRLSAGDLAAALRQLASAPGLAARNPHLLPQELQAIGRGQWPQTPVFTPYAYTHHHYSQIRYIGIKYLTHRLTYQSFYNNINPALEVSHTLYLGSMTSANINPLHLTIEDGILNQTRKACALFFEAKLIEWEDGRLGAPSWSDEDFVAWMATQNPVCGIIHAEHRCSCAPRHWMAITSLDEIGG